MTSRRSILKMLSGITTGLAGLRPELVSAMDAIDKDEMLPDAVIRDCTAVYVAWIARESVSPPRYLSAKLNSTGSPGGLKMTELIDRDFANNEIFVIDGLVLSKSEAASLACIGYLHGKFES